MDPSQRAAFDKLIRATLMLRCDGSEIVRFEPDGSIYVLAIKVNTVSIDFKAWSYPPNC